MKILTILLILLQINTFGYGNYSSPYSNRYNSYSSVPVEQTNRRIGYTTNYGNTFGYTTQQTYYRGTYTPTASNSGGAGKPGIRKVHVYGNDGSENETPGGNKDGEDWLYQFDGTDWWCSQDDGQTWKKWDSWWGWGLIGFDWRPGRGDPTEGSTHYHHDPNNPWATPIGDPDFYLITALLFSYFIYNYMKKRRQQFLLYTGI